MYWGGGERHDSARAKAHVWWSEANMWELVFFPLRGVCLGDQTHIRLGSKSLYPLNHPGQPKNRLFLFNVSFCLHSFNCTKCTHAQESQEALDPLEVKLGMGSSCHIGAENRFLIL